MSERFYAPTDLTQSTVELSGPEAHHLAVVLRLGPGDRVVLFDGEGTEADAEITSVSRKAVQLAPGELQRDPPSAQTVILAAAAPKGERFRWLVEKATELGVSRLVPLETERSVVEPGAGKLEKLRQVVIAACKQCGCNRLMQLDPPLRWTEFNAREASDGRLLVAHPGGRPARAVFGGNASPDPCLLLAVGPEGGFTEAEIALAINVGASVVSLGPRILRIETAALAFAALALVRSD